MNPTLTPQQLHSRLDDLTVIDVRSPGEYADGHIPGARNIPLDRLQQALPELRTAARDGGLVLVCASGARSQTARAKLAKASIPALDLTGGTSAWARDGLPLDRSAGAPTVWPMDRQVRLGAGSLIVLGLIADLFVPGLRVVSAAVGCGLVVSALINRCGMATLLGKLPYNRRANNTCTLYPRRG
ncbi:rhodanese-like domain-containing protein [Streptomyces sp. NPDC001880]